ncbi:hypothetical protein Syun_022054 [Stephania yunnanensis]|uniref:Uncharacterized protein n=1 Tax=Stephania yunnanensis TaxID=152371 RepID=A0AAP0IH41_9MAGN
MISGLAMSDDDDDDDEGEGLIRLCLLLPEQTAPPGIDARSSSKKGEKSSWVAKRGSKEGNWGSKLGDSESMEWSQEERSAGLKWVKWAAWSEERNRSSDSRGWGWGWGWGGFGGGHGRTSSPAVRACGRRRPCRSFSPGTPPQQVARPRRGPGPGPGPPISSSPCSPAEY